MLQIEWFFSWTGELPALGKCLKTLFCYLSPQRALEKQSREQDVGIAGEQQGLWKNRAPRYQCLHSQQVSAISVRIVSVDQITVNPSPFYQGSQRSGNQIWPFMATSCHKLLSNSVQMLNKGETRLVQLKFSCSYVGVLSWIANDKAHRNQHICACHTHRSCLKCRCHRKMYLPSLHLKGIIQHLLKNSDARHVTRHTKKGHKQSKNQYLFKMNKYIPTHGLRTE